MATNTVGASNWSSQGDSSPAVVTLPPVAMAMPKSISTSGDTITITWAELVGADTNGQDIISYRIGYSQCEDVGLTNCGDW